MAKSLLHFFQFLYRSGAVRQSSGMTAITFASGILLAVSFILVSRILGPERFGVLSVCLSLMAILLKIPDAGLNQAMLKLLGNFHDRQESVSGLRKLFWNSKVWLSTGLFIVGSASVPVLQHVLNFPYPHLLLLSVIGSAIYFFYDYVSVVLSTTHQFVWVGVLGFLQAFTKFVGFSALFLLGVQFVFPYLLIYSLAVPAATAVIFLLQRGNLGWAKSVRTFSLDQKAQSLIVHSAIGTLLFTLISHVDVLIVQGTLNAFDTGIYAGATRIALFITFVASAVRGVLTNRVSRYQRRNVLREYLKKVPLLVAACALGFLLFLPLAQTFVFWTVGAEYVSGTPIVVLLVLNAFLGLALVPFIAFFYAVDRPSYFSMSGVIQVLFLLGGNFLFLGEYGLQAAAWSRIVATLALGVFTLWATAVEFKKIAQ